MAFEAQTGGARILDLPDAMATAGVGERMGYWRWLVFAAMSWLQVREETYLRIPNAKTTRRVVILGRETRDRLSASAE